MKTNIEDAINKFLAKGGNVQICRTGRRALPQTRAKATIEDKEFERAYERHSVISNGATFNSEEMGYMAGKTRWALNENIDLLSCTDYAALDGFSSKIYKQENLTKKQAKYIIDILIRYDRKCGGKDSRKLKKLRSRVMPC